MEDLARAVIETGRQRGETNLALSAKTVGRWERGESHPRPPYPKLLCAVFEVTASEIGLADRAAGGPASGPLVLPRSATRTTALGNHLVVPASRYSAESDLEAGAPPPSRGYDRGAIILLAQMVQALRRLGDRLRSPYLVGPALELRSTIMALAEVGLDDESRAGTLRICSELELILGWLAHDAADFSTARGYYQEALGRAHRVRDHDLVLCAVGHIATLAADEGKLLEAQSILEADWSQEVAAASTFSLSWLASVEAHVLASTGRQTECWAAIERSRQMFESDRRENVPPCLIFFDRAELEASKAGCEELVGGPETALTIWAGALELLEAARVRDRARFQSHMANLSLRIGDIAGACRLAGEALQLAVDVGSRLVHRRLRELGRELRPWRETAPVREYLERLAEARRAFA